MKLRKDVKRIPLSEIGDGLFQYFIDNHTGGHDFLDDKGNFSHVPAIHAMLLAVAQMVRESSHEYDRNTAVKDVFETVIGLDKEFQGMLNDDQAGDVLDT